MQSKCLNDIITEKAFNFSFNKFKKPEDLIKENNDAVYEILKIRGKKSLILI